MGLTHASTGSGLLLGLGAARRPGEPVIALAGNPTWARAPCSTH